MQMGLSFNQIGDSGAQDLATVLSVNQALATLYLEENQVVYLPVCLSIYLSIRLSIYLSIPPSVYLSLYVSIYLSIHTCMHTQKHAQLLPCIRKRTRCGTTATGY